MNLDKKINIQLLVLSNKYDISVTHIRRVKDGELKQSYLVSYNKKVKKDKVKDYQKKWFSNKYELIEWLLWLEK